MQRIELPYQESALPYFQHLAGEAGAIWFHGGQPRRAGHHWEWCAAWPSERFQYLGNGQVQCLQGRQTFPQVSDFFRFLNAHIRPKPPRGLPFSTGLAGHANYELGHELLGTRSRHPAQSALASVDRYDWSLSIDHQNKRCQVLIDPNCADDTRDRIRHLIDHWQTPPEDTTAASGLHWRSLMTDDVYRTHFEQLQEYIRAGDIYQANFTRQWVADVPKGTTSLALYRALLDAVPAPYSVYHQAMDHTLLSVSPERFMTVDGRRIVTQPIKGTRGRGATPERDQRLSRALLNSEKDRAENLMIVDLLRNDLSRNATVGSVRVPQLFELQTYSNVHHLVSTITAELAEGSTPLDLLADAFPGGSITGAPKRRAMQIIDELELAARGPYCGSAFWMSDDGYFDSNILIRTLTHYPGKVVCAGGGGIVADSDWQAEFEESVTKVRHLMAALGSVASG
ncbi:MAG: aminodeoxychorismate synthase component I [Saccharospirillum sp.]